MVNGFKRKVKEDIMKEGYPLTESYSKFIDDEWLPSKSLGTI